MKIAFFIIGIILLVLGIFTTGWSWYDAATNGRFSSGGAYAGPVLIILGLLRIFRAAASVPMPGIARMAIVGIAILCGYGNAAAIKAVFPQALVEQDNASAPASSTAVSTPNN